MIWCPWNYDIWGNVSWCSNIDVYASISDETRGACGPASGWMLHERDTATSWRPVRARKRERQADIYGRGVREALKLRLLATALAVFTMMFGASLSLSLFLSSLYLGVPPFLSPRSLFDAVLLARLALSSPSCRAPKISTVVPWVRETRRTEGEEQERSVISRLSGIAGFLESCRSSPFPISNVPRFHEPQFLRFRIFAVRICQISLVRL